MKKNVAVFFMSLIASELFAQSDFGWACVIMSSQDTLHGFINDGEGLRKDPSCDFNKSKTAAVGAYIAADIGGYHFVNDKFFVSKRIKSHADTVAAITPIHSSLLFNFYPA